MVPVLAGVRRAGCALISTVAVVLVAAPPAIAAPKPEGKAVAVQSLAGGAKRIKYRIGPFNVVPGQNSIGFRRSPRSRRSTATSPASGRTSPTSTAAFRASTSSTSTTGCGSTVPARDATRPFLPERFFAAGEEKTHMRLPKGYGYPVKASDALLLNHMIHNLTPVPTQVYMVYEVDFVPRGSRAARGIRPVRPIWMDVQNGSVYPVFNVRKGSGQERPLHVSRTTPRTPTRAARRRTSGSSTGRACSSRPPGHLHPAASTRT